MLRPIRVISLLPVILACGMATAAAQFSYGFEPGERVPDVPVTLPDGKTASLRNIGGAQGAVLITRDSECPVAQRYMPRIAEIAQEAAGKGFTLMIVDVTPEADAKPVPGNLATIRDPGNRIASALRADTSAEAFVIDRAGTLRYRGAIDDQYGVTHQRATASHHWLRDAIAKVAAGDDPDVRRTGAPGCVIAHDATGTVKLDVTYHDRVSRIIQARCEVCHRAGGLAPMPLQSYAQVYARRAMIKAMVTAGLMPPWSAKKGVGHWANDRSLSDRDKADLLAWIDAGAPEGDARDAPVARAFDSRWNIGTPDAVVSIPEPIRVPAQGVVEYKNVYVKTGFAEDKWITAMEIRPTQPKVVHHVIVVLDEPGRKPLTAEQRARLEPGQPMPPQPVDTAAGFFAITVPGSLGMRFPEGTGKLLPRGAWLRFEIHYQPNGEEVMDKTEIGFRFSARPLRRIENLSALNTTFTIPPNDPDYRIVATHKLAVAGELLSLFPHMHLRGRSFRFDLRYPDGKTVELLDVPRFDFNWQSYYEFRDPLRVPAGSSIIATARYDNSRNNSWNPDPSKAVRWGPQSFEEMMIGYFDFLPSVDKRAAPAHSDKRR